ncbi:MAG: IS1634 family transposase [Caldisericia bacterium]|nr:IS1634 family transposase [Caldisericia bacterium]
MAIVKQLDKRSGITYVYESIAYWDKNKQQSRAHRKLIGKVDKTSGAIVPTRPRPSKTVSHSQLRPVRRSFFGATYLLDALGKQLELEEDLRKCFPELWDQILSIAYFLILESNSPLSRFPKWASLHQHPYGSSIPSQRSSDLFAAISEREEERYHFFRLQAKRRIEKEYWAYDSTSISSYSECLRQVKYGRNKEHDHLAQLNLLLLFGEHSGLPFYYRQLPGNIPDVTTVRRLLSEMDFLSLKKIHLVMDRGFYSKHNLNELYRKHLKFLIGAKLSLRLVQEQLAKVRGTLKQWDHYLEASEVFATCIPLKWNYEQEQVRKGVVLQEERRIYLHLYYSSEKAQEDESKLMKLLLQLQRELQHKERNPVHETLYERYFHVSESPVRGVKILAKQEIINDSMKNYGYFALLSNEVKDPEEALNIYRSKDIVEKAFGNLKERLSMRRMLVSSEHSLNGKLFVQFIALIYLSSIKKRMQEQNLFRTYTLQEVLDELDGIECYEGPGHRQQVGEITKKQTELYQQLGVEPPTSL